MTKASICNTGKPLQSQCENNPVQSGQILTLQGRRELKWYLGMKGCPAVGEMQVKATVTVSTLLTEQ